MKYIALLFSILLWGCAATPIEHTASKVESKETAAKIIEQLIMEQPAKHRPESLIITEEYIAFEEGMVADSTAYVSTTIPIAISSTKGKNLHSRIYFNSLSYIKLFQKRDWYIIQVKTTNSRNVKNFYTLDKRKADEFIDALNLYKII